MTTSTSADNIVTELGNLTAQLMRAEANILAAIGQRQPDHRALLDSITCEPALAEGFALGDAAIVLNDRLRAAGFTPNEAHLLARAPNLLREVVAQLGQGG